MRVRSDFNKIHGAVNINALDSKTKNIVHAIDRYYKHHTSHGKIDFTVFLPFFERNVYPKMDKDDVLVYRAVIKNMTKGYPDADTRTKIMESIHELNLVYSIDDVVEKYNRGDDIDPVQRIKETMDVYERGVGVTALPEVTENIDELLDDMDNQDGLKFRLKCLRDSLRPLRGGDFVILGARPDQGKTSFICSEVTYMAAQMPEDRCVLWLNNEGPGYAIRPRLMQAALDCTNEDLLAKKEAGTLYDEYYEVMGGENRVRVMDIHGYNNGQVESLIESTRPALIIYDMIDNIHGFGSEARTDLALEKMYQWAREKCVKYDSAAIATSQISSEGIDEMYPGLGMLKDSKTGKQGACEAQIMIGSKETKPEYENIRWISTPKNKLRRTGSPRVLHKVNFRREHARYEDAETET